MVKKAIESGRIAGKIKGDRASVVTKFMQCNSNGIDPNSSVLDFGTGLYAKQAVKLSEKYPNIKAWDYAEIYSETIKEKPELKELFLNRLGQTKFDVIMASNVINVQETPKELKETLQKLYCNTKKGGTILINIPKSPIYYTDNLPHNANGHNLSEMKEDIMRELHPYFNKDEIEEVKTICGEKNSTFLIKINKKDHKDTLCNRPIY